MIFIPDSAVLLFNLPSSPEMKNEEKIPEIFQLNVPFKNQCEVHLENNEEEVYTQRTFRELIEEKEKKSLPYFLVLTEDSMGNVGKFDGLSFLRAYFKFDQHDCSTNRLSIKSVNFYKIFNLANPLFQFFCTLEDLKKDLEEPKKDSKDSENFKHSKNFFAKYLNACDLTLDTKKRGPERCYLVSRFQEGFFLKDVFIKPNEKEAQFWLDRALEDQTYLVYIQLSFFYAIGKMGYPKSSEKAYHYFNLAKEKADPSDPVITDLSRKFSSLGFDKKD